MAKKRAVAPNQYTNDPRKGFFCLYYFDPKSPTFSNATRSAVRAGFDEAYANNITAKMPQWLKDKLQEHNVLLMKAERNLQEALDFPTQTQAMGMFGKIYEKVPVGKKVRGQKQKYKQVPVMKENIGLIKIRTDVSTFIAERVGRKVYGKAAEEAPPPNSILNITQIVINQPKQA